MGCISAKEQRSGCTSRAGCLCMCGLEGVTTIAAPGTGWYGYYEWSSTYDWRSTPGLSVVIYPRSELLSINGMLWRFQFGCRRLGRHDMEKVTGLDLTLHETASHRLLGIIRIQGTNNTENLIQPVGLATVRALQRRVRGTRRRLAVAMALHGRLGAASALGELGEDLVCSILVEIKNHY